MSSHVRTPRFHELVALDVALVAGPTAAQTAGPKAAIEAANAKFSADFAKGDAKAVASHYTAAAWAFPPNGEIAKGERYFRHCARQRIVGSAPNEAWQLTDLAFRSRTRKRLCVGAQTTLLKPLAGVPA